MADGDSTQIYCRIVIPMTAIDSRGVSFAWSSGAVAKHFGLRGRPVFDSHRLCFIALTLGPHT